MKKSYRKRYLVFITLFVIVASILLPQTIAYTQPCTCAGFCYIDDEKIIPDNVRLDFPGYTFEAMIFATGQYIIDFPGPIGSTGTFNITYNDGYYMADETITIIEDLNEYFIDLHVTTYINSQPDKPTDPIPENNTEDYEITEISVFISDPDDDTLNVSFYLNDELLEQKNNILGDTRVSADLPELTAGQKMFWYVEVDDEEYTVRSDTWNFKKIIDENNPPNMPTSPIPENNSEDIDINPTLSVIVNDPDGDLLDVYFYNASDDSLIGYDENIPYGSRIEVQWLDLSYNRVYSWYVVVNDSEYETKSDIWNFKTEEKTYIPPFVEIIKPLHNSIYLFDNFRIPLLRDKVLILGPITIMASAGDDIGINKIELRINDKLEYTEFSDQLEWTWDERVIGSGTISVKAYDNEDLTSVDSIDITIINLNIF